MPRISKNKKRDKKAEIKPIKRKATDNTDNENMTTHKKSPLTEQEIFDASNAKIGEDSDSESTSSMDLDPQFNTNDTSHLQHLQQQHLLHHQQQQHQQQLHQQRLRQLQQQQQQHQQKQQQLQHQQQHQGQQQQQQIQQNSQNQSTHHSLSSSKSNSAATSTNFTESSQLNLKNSSSPSQTPSGKNSAPQPPPVYSKSNCGPYIVFIEPRSSSSSTSSPSSLNPTTIGRLLSPSYNPNFISIKSSGKNKITISLKNSFSANKLITGNILFQNNLKASIPYHRLFRQGIIRDIPKDLSDNHILNSLDSHILIVGARRLKRRINRNPSETELVDTNSILLTFDGQSLPTHIKLFSVIHEVEQYISPTKMCFACFRYGHLKNLCKGKCLCSRCGHKQHDPSDTTDVCSRHDLPPLCINCQGKHLPTDKSCPEYIFQRKVHHYAATHNTSIQEALAFLDTNDPPTHNSRSVQTIKLSTSKSSSLPPTSNPQHFPFLSRRDLNINSTSNLNSLQSTVQPRNTSYSHIATHPPSHQPSTPSSQHKASYAASLNSRLAHLLNQSSHTLAVEAAHQIPHQEIVIEENEMLSFSTPYSLAT
ncbi:hypothetical protein TKK_0008144 [Trichogramma kaykai]|uniref:CCHC-type domain-containing protein n=1 Tax=Trichogramma kaykai TaxID=54128 RepID=A0ABD2X7M8_9HYME